MKVDGFKKAALKLFTLATADRDWVLGELPEEERKALRSLIAEVKGSGIKPVFLPFDDLVETPLAVNAAPAAVGATDAQGTLMALGLPELERLVVDEADWVVSALFNAHPWPWRSSLLLRMPPARRNRIQDGIAVREIKPRVLASIVEATAAKHRTAARSRTANGLLDRVARSRGKGD